MSTAPEKTDRPRILVIEDEAPIRRFLRASLSAHGMDVREAATAADGIREATAQPMDVIVLDLGLPDRDGLDVVAEIRSWSDVPIVVLSAREKEGDKVLALDAGADDYLTKPFAVGELLARLRVALRHKAARGKTETESVYRRGALAIDLARRAVERDRQTIHLTPIEFRLLAELVRHAGRVLTHRHLLTHVWGPTHTSEVQYLRVFMGQVRKKIERDPAQPEIVQTEPGIGYRLAPSE